MEKNHKDHHVGEIANKLFISRPHLTINSVKPGKIIENGRVTEPLSYVSIQLSKMRTLPDQYPGCLCAHFLVLHLMYCEIKNLFNDWYARNISKKRRISNKIRGGSGLSLSPPPYGYMKDPENPQRWISDEEAAYVVRKIFDVSMEGLGTFQIALALNSDKVLTSSEYAIKKV